ncbi:hypothetical protein GCM10010104_24710 [Streptomyces indiaensis]|uniref:Helix-turn-helix of DDE superfamily endonuclease n=1 Tax=Streptomyces indiaensis TaxID=284033 RepID=A0ABP5QDN1_9ACTN
MWMETFTGVPMGRFEKLLRVVRERRGNGPGGGRPWCLPLAERVLLVAVYYRTNLTMRAARTALRLLTCHRLPGHPASWALACDGAGAQAGTGRGPAMDRGRHPDPGA